MKLKLLLPLIALLALGTACEKPEKPEPIDQNPLGDKPPCYGSFSCTINGEPFQSYGTGGGCSPRSISYNISSHHLFVYGTDCRVEGYDFRNVVFETSGVIGVGKFPITNGNCAYITVIPQADSYNEVIAGEVTIKKVIPPPYSEDFEGGYIEGTFWMTNYSEEADDTVKVTNGEFCGTF